MPDILRVFYAGDAGDAFGAGTSDSLRERDPPVGNRPLLEVIKGIAQGDRVNQRKVRAAHIVKEGKQRILLGIWGPRPTPPAGVWTSDTIDLGGSEEGPDRFEAELER